MAAVRLIVSACKMEASLLSPSTKRLFLFGFFSFSFFKICLLLHSVIKAERKKVLMWSLQFTKHRLHPSVSFRSGY